ncbi:MAG: hypothetical protein AAF329_20770 [Cyanobacteria bacterium P01_A01_bin.17]
MKRLSQKQRWIPQLEALWRGLTLEDIAILQEAMDYFDGGYNSLMNRLEKLGATQQIYAVVNGTAKTIMGKSRTDVDLWNADEMEVWGDGYQGTLEELDAYQLYQVLTIELAQQATQRGFTDG